MSRREDDGNSEKGSPDTQEVFDWEPRSLFDRLVHRGYPFVRSGLRAGTVVVALLLLVLSLAPAEFAPVTDPVIAGFVLLSVLPAVALAGYVWYSDITGAGPLWLLVVTFLLGVLFANFASVINEVAGRVVVLPLVDQGLSLSAAWIVLFFLVVAPAEELVKLLAVHFRAYRSPRFDSVISGAVYGAIAGLGFATIENAFYITQVVEEADGFVETLTDGGVVASVRALAGPGHVIWSAIAGYYLGLAKFNRHHAGPIVLKGLVLAILFHAVYNALVTEVLGLVTDATGVSPVTLFFIFAVGYNGVLFAFLLYKLSRYRAVYRERSRESAIESELTEFDP